MEGTNCSRSVFWRVLSGTREFLTVRRRTQGGTWAPERGDAWCRAPGPSRGCRCSRWLAARPVSPVCFEGGSEVSVLFPSPAPWRVTAFHTSQFEREGGTRFILSGAVTSECPSPAAGRHLPVLEPYGQRTQSVGPAPGRMAVGRWP